MCGNELASREALVGSRTNLKPRRVTEGAKDARRIIDKRLLVEDAQAISRDVGGAAEDIQELRLAGETERKRIAGEVAPRQIGLDTRGLDLRQRASSRVALAARHCEVDADAADGRRRRPESLVGRHACMRKRGPKNGRRDTLQAPGRHP